jgi:hypothetical protein
MDGTTMNLDEKQRQQVAQWIKEGLKLSEIQKLLDQEMGIRMTYMEVRFLMDDLKLQPVDPVVQVAPVKPLEAAPATPTPAAGAVVGAATPPPVPSMPGPGQVSLELDSAPHPGALVSGKVTFTDGMTATWSLDQSGRLGMAPSVKGYRPSEGDVQQFQAALEEALSRSGI